MLKIMLPYIIRSIFAVCFIFTAVVFSESRLSAADNDDIDGPQKVLVYSFNNTSKTLKEKEPSADEQFDYLSDIFPINLKREIETAGSFIVSIDRLPADVQITSDSEKKSFLKKVSEEKNTAFAVYGSYSVTKGIITVTVDVYSRRSGQMKTVQAESKKLGVMIDSLLSDLTSKTIPELQKMVQKRAASPSFVMQEDPLLYYGSVSLQPEQPQDEMWYTSDGTEPSKENGKQYKDPLSFRSSKTIKAVTYRDGFFVSKPSEKNVTVVTPISHLTIGQTFGSAQFVGKIRKELKTEAMNHFAGFLIWDLANIEAVKKNSFLRGFALSASFETARASAQSKSDSSGSGGGEPGTGFITYYAGWAVYSFRLADFLFLDLSAGGGYGQAKLIKKFNGNGPLDLINYNPDPGEKVTGKMYGGGLKLHYIWGRLFFHSDAGYRTMKIDNMNFNSIFTGIGLGIRL